MRIKLTSIMVDDQEKALQFYTDVLGFTKKHDIPVGEYRWLTVVSPEGPNDIELAGAQCQSGRQSVPGGDVCPRHTDRRVRGQRPRARVRATHRKGRRVHTTTRAGRAGRNRRVRR